MPSLEYGFWATIAQGLTLHARLSKIGYSSIPILSRRDTRQVGIGEESLQGGLNPSRPASMIPGSQQAGPESESNIPPESGSVKGKEQYVNKSLWAFHLVIC